MAYRRVFKYDYIAQNILTIEGEFKYNNKGKNIVTLNLLIR